MITLQQRAGAVIQAAWNMLPASRARAAIREIKLDDLDTTNGVYEPGTGNLTLNVRLFFGSNQSHFPLIDHMGESPPMSDPFVSRALHTSIHEMAHAIGRGTGLDRSDEWMALCGWVEDYKEVPGFGRYVERRPGWEQGPAEWRYLLGSWFPRDYSTKSPFEDFADCVTLRALRWEHRFRESDHGKMKLHFIQSNVWGGPPVIGAMRARTAAAMMRS